MKIPRLTGPIRSHLIAIFSILAVTAPISSDVFAAGDLAKLLGSWSGGGIVKLSGGKSEKIRCRAYYTSKQGGSRIGLAIRCASTASKFELRAKLTQSGGTVTGTWEERTNNATGNVSGHVSQDALKLTVSGPLQGLVTISTKGKKQWVSISTTGTSLRSITISLRRRP